MRQVIRITAAFVSSRINVSNPIDGIIDSRVYPRNKRY